MKVFAVKYSFIFLILALFLFSFTQIDLGLTLTKASIFQTIQTSFQTIGYFNRPLSLAFYLLIISGMFTYYLYFLRQVIRKKINARHIWTLIISTAVILAFSYNAFSYDLFNYIFDAKIITHYHLNPYAHRALDFPGDPMLSFMQWTHRLYPYGPVWLGLTVPLSYIGLNFFLVTFFLFKFLSAAFYLGCCYLIYKINKKILPEYQNFNLVLFALNPLVIIESLVSSHNDIAMMFFALLGLYLYFLRKKILAIILIIVSSQIKIPTIALLAPIIISFLPNKIKNDNNKFVYLSIFVMLGTLGYVLTKLEVQPWYFLWIMPLIALLKPNRYIIALTFGFSLGLLLRYSVFLYFGNWDGIALPLRNAFTVFATIIPVILVFIQDKFGRKLL